MATDPTLEAITANLNVLGTLAANNVFPLARPHGGGPWANSFSADPDQAL